MFTVWVRGAAADSGTWKVPVLVGTVVGAVVLAAAAYLVRKAQAEEARLPRPRPGRSNCPSAKAGAKPAWTPRTPPHSPGRR